MMCRSLKLDFKSSTCLFTCVLIVLYFWGVVIVLLLLGFCWFDLVWVFSPHSLALSYCLLMHHCYNTKIATSQDLFQWHKKEAAAWDFSYNSYQQYLRRTLPPLEAADGVHHRVFGCAASDVCPFYEGKQFNLQGVCFFSAQPIMRDLVGSSAQGESSG